MVFMFDEIKGTGESFPGFPERKQELNEALLDIAHAAGDCSHKAGGVDYVVRFTTSKWTLAYLPAPNAFLLVDNVDNLLVFHRRGEGSLELKLELAVEENWFDQTCTAFQKFRSDLDFSTQTA
jgi:hypothetical protein